MTTPVRLRAITPDWQSRVANYEVCMRRELREYVENAGIQVIGYRVRPLMELARREA